MKKRLSLLILVFTFLSAFAFAETKVIGEVTPLGRLTEVSAIPEREGYYKLTFEEAGTPCSFIVKKGSVIKFKSYVTDIKLCFKIYDITDNEVSMTLSFMQ